jgi:hypothetical protein
MSLTLLGAVTLINDAQTLVTVLTPLVEQAKALGGGDDHVITDAELDARAAQVGANVQTLRDMVKP